MAKSAVKGVSWTAGSIMIRAGLQFAQLLLVARYLTPAELGVLAMINVIIGLAQIFGEAGLSNAIIYYKDLTAQQLNQLYLLNIGFGFIITFIFFCLSQPLANFFEMEDLAGMLLLIAPVFLIRSFSQQSIALLQKELKFGLLAKAETLSAILGFIVLLIFFISGFRAKAVIFGQLAGAGCLSLLVMFYNQARLPKLSYIYWSEIEIPVKYGLYQSGEACVNYLGSQFDRIFIGKMLGAEVLGIYSYIRELAFRPAYQFVNPIVHRVGFPMLAKHRDSHELGYIYAKMLNLLALLNVPLYLLLVMFPSAVLGFVFGETWVEHSEILRWLAIYMLFMSFINPVGTLLRATGSVKRGFWWNIVIAAFRPAVIFFCIPYGITSVVKVLAIQQVFLFFAHWFVLINPIVELSFRFFIGAFLRSIIMFVVSYLIVYLLTFIFIDMKPLLQAVLVGVVYLVMLVPVIKKLVSDIRKSDGC
ncbi:MOP flippase family protein [Shewanella morhuae]|nr:MOP flippase family protein [Shewanella morhuae]